MKKQTRDRLVLPILLPVGILVVIVAALYGFSRILLSISHNAATATALVVALAIVVVSAVVAGRRIVRPSSFAGLVGAVTGVAMIAGGIALATVGTEGEGGGEGEGPATNVTIVAVNIAFQPTEIEVPAGQPFTITLDNQDAGIQHNVDIFDNPDFSGDPVFAGDLVTGPAQITYEVPALEPGTYPFRCVVHPNMVGTIRAVEGGGGGGGPGGPVVEVVAQDIAFDTDTIELPANTPSTIAFDNRDAGVQHNVDIFDNAEFSGTALFEGELITGVRETDYLVDPLAPGGYFFRCLVHPTMVGEMEAVPGGGGGGEGGPGAGPTVVAQDIAFDTSTIELSAGVPSTITFDNRDAGVQHNIAIYTDESLATELFNGELVTGAATVEYSIPPLEAGEYFFHCVIHPNMNGTVAVSEGGGEGGGGATGPTGAGPPTGATGEEPPAGGAAEPSVLIAQNLAFDTSTITLPAGQGTTITLDNRDAGIQHNIMITTDSTLSTQLFNGELITGPATIEYQIPPLDAGEYYFLCLVHPNMNGTVIVA